MKRAVMRKCLLLSGFLLINILFSRVGAQVKTTDVLEAGKVGAVAKTAAVNENIDSASKIPEEATNVKSSRSKDADKELKKRYVFAAAGFITIVIITLSIRRRRKVTSGQE